MHSYVAAKTILADELDFLDKIGFEVDGVRYYAKLIRELSDFRGLQGSLEMGGSPGVHGCLKCWTVGCSKQHGLNKVCVPRFTGYMCEAAGSRGIE